MVQASLINHALRLLAIREHSRFELKQKLSKHSQDQVLIEQTLDQLIQQDYLSEQRYVEAYIHSRKNKGYGPNLIRQELSLKKVPYPLVEQILAEETQWRSITEKAYQKKFKGHPVADVADKAKRIRFLQRRGFLNDDIRAIVQ